MTSGVKDETTVPSDRIAARMDVGARSTVNCEIRVPTQVLPKDANWRTLRAKIVSSDELTYWNLPI